VPTAALHRRGWCLYLVKCADGTLYTGITNDLQRRLRQHNRGTASRYTRSRLPVQLVYREGCRDKSGALKKEHRVKSLSRTAKFAYIAKTARPPTLAAARREAAVVSASSPRRKLPRREEVVRCDRSRAEDGPRETASGPVEGELRMEGGS